MFVLLFIHLFIDRLSNTDIIYRISMRYENLKLCAHSSGALTLKMVKVSLTLKRFCLRKLEDGLCFLIFR